MPADWIVWDVDFDTRPSSLIGGKAAGLGVIARLGLPLPRAFCVTTAALRDTAARAGLAGKAGTPGDEPAAALALAGGLARVALPGPLREAIGGALRALTASPSERSGGLAVRSSFASEDTAEAASAGVYRSEIGLRSEAEVLDAIRRVWASAFGPAAIDYRRGKGLPVLDLGMAVIVQRAPAPVAGGVAYTLLPGEQDPTAMLVEYAPGPPSRVVDHLVDPERVVLRKHDLSPAPSDPPGGPPDGPPGGPVTGAHLRQLAAGALRLERAAGAPVDVEWLVGGDGRLQFLQLRRLGYTRPPGQPGAYVGEARGTGLRSAKLAPFRLPDGLGLRTVDAHLLLPAAFEAFKASGRELPPRLELACRAVFDDYRRRGPVSIRSAFWSALGSGDMLPQSPRLTTTDGCLEFTRAYWTYVIEHRLDDYSAEVALLVSNWAEPYASVIATTAERGGAVKVLVTALYGHMEGLETCAHDVYEVDAGSLAVERAMVPEKRSAVLTPRRPPEPVPGALRGTAVLAPDDLRTVARDAGAIHGVLGPVRVESLVLAPHGAPPGAPPAARVLTWQVTPLSTPDVGIVYYTVRPAAAGTAAGTADRAGAGGRLARLRDPAAAAAFAARARGDEVALIDFERFELRDPEMATSVALALRDAGCPVVLKGSLLSHLAALLRDHGLAVFPTNEPNDAIPDGQWVAVTPR